MHEWALAEAVVETVKKHIVDREKTEVKSVTVLFGELQKIDREIFQTGLRMLLEDEDFSEEIFQFDEEKAIFQCRQCHSEWSLDEPENLGEDEREAIHFMPETAHVYMRCPECKSPDFEVSKGRGVSISSMVLEEG